MADDDAAKAHHVWLARIGRLLLWLIKPVVGAIVVALVLALATPTIISEAAAEVPTCANPSGLRKVPMATRLLDGTASVSPSGQFAGLDTLSADEVQANNDLYHPFKMFDGRVRSGWGAVVPQLRRLTPEEALAEAVGQERGPDGGAGDAVGALYGQVKLSWQEPPVDVRMMCVVNGIPVTQANYLDLSRVRELEIRSSCDQDRATVVQLLDLGTTSRADPQLVPLRCDGMTELTLTVRSIYTPDRTIEMSQDRKFELVGIAEIAFYEVDPDRDGSVLTPMADVFQYLARHL